MEPNEASAQARQAPAPDYLDYAQPGPGASIEDLIKWDEYQRQLRRRRFLRFPYPVLVVMLYLFLGLTFGWWHPSWLMFLSIPLYYGMASAI